MFNERIKYSLVRACRARRPKKGCGMWIKVLVLALSFGGMDCQNTGVCYEETIEIEDENIVEIIDEIIEEIGIDDFRAMLQENETTVER